MNRTDDAPARRTYASTPSHVEADTRARDVLRRYEEQEARLLFHDRLRLSVLAGTALAVVLAVLWALSGEGCGDLAHADSLSEGSGGATRRADGPSDARGSIAAAPPEPDAEAFALAARMAAFQPLWTPRREGELEAVAGVIVTACRRDPWPTPARCPDLLAALAFRESSWRTDAIGARGELGLFQLLPGVALAGETRADALDPEVNARLALAHLRRAQAMCALLGRGDVATALGMYGSGRCLAYRGSRLLERWESELQRAAEPAQNGDRT